MARLPATTSERQILRNLETEFRTNNPTMALLDPSGMLHFWKAYQLVSGKTEAEAIAHLRTLVDDAHLESLWDQIEGVLNSGRNYTASILDARLLVRLARDLSLGGSVLSTYRINTYNGKQYIIFKGAQRARQILIGTRYLASNSKVVSMGVGRAGAANSIKGGMLVTLFLSIGFRAVEQFLNEEATWHNFVGGLAADIAKIAVAGGASMIAAALVGGTAATVGAFAVGPLFAGIVVGVAVGVALDYVDQRIGFTQAIVNGLREAQESLTSNLREARRQYEWYTRTPELEYDFWMRVFGARY